jgi:hypothetical protein
MAERKHPRQLTRTADLTAPISTVRERVAHAIEGASLRAVAREIGISPTGLQNFADGGTPYRGTRRKLVEWYTVHAAATVSGAVSPDAAAAALDLLVHELPPHRRPDARLRIVRALRDAYERSAIDPPGWLDE